MAHLPLARTRTIMKTTEGVEAISKEAVFVMTRATELFIKQLSLASVKNMNKEKRLSYNNLVQVVHSISRYEFLEYMIPKKITVREYKKLMAKKKAQELKSESLQDEHQDEDIVEIPSTGESDSNSSNE